MLEIVNHTGPRRSGRYQRTSPGLVTPQGAGGARVRGATVIPAAFSDAAYRTVLVSGLAQAYLERRRRRCVTGLTTTYCEHVRGQRATTWSFGRGSGRGRLSGTSGYRTGCPAIKPAGVGHNRPSDWLCAEF